VTRAAVSLLAEIRSATATAHARIERQVNLTVPWSRARYLGFLYATLAVVGPTEPALRYRFGDERFPLLTGAADRLRRDLESLGAPAAARGPMPVPVVASEAHALGAAYVLHGSLLGGQIIARTLQAQLGLYPSNLTYLRPAADVGSQWRAFTAELDAWGDTASTETRSTAVAAALALFDAFGIAFAREGLR
jgi:heme oxygenase